MQNETPKYEFYKQLSVAYRNAAKLMRQAAAIHVEAAEDKLFWEKIFKFHSPEKDFHFITYTRTEKGCVATGCTTCLSYRDFLSDDFFICIDSDYRYLLQEKNIDIQHAVFQTYTYSIENHYCYSKGINKVFEQLGLENKLFDFEAFLMEYSQSLYPLFLYHLHSLSIRDNIFTKELFRSLLNIDKAGLNHEVMISQLKRRSEKVLSEIKRYYPDVMLEKLEKKYQQSGLTSENAYLYFRGHNIFERVVLPIAKEIRKSLTYKHVESFESKEKGDFFAQNKELKTYFMENIHWKEYPEINKIEKDLHYFFKTK